MGKRIEEPWTPDELVALGDKLMERGEQVAAVALSHAAAALRAADAEYIAQSKELIAEIRKPRAQEWVSVEERLPPQGLVIGFNSKIGKVSEIYVNFPNNYLNSEWTHWMPLPPPPIGESDE